MRFPRFSEGFGVFVEKKRLGMDRKDSKGKGIGRKERVFVMQSYIIVAKFQAIENHSLYPVFRILIHYLTLSLLSGSASLL